ncbi:MAG: GlmU family protein [Bacteroidetes bacterium]|nr:GlmU family protein [Bacteroidota bacterium]
MNLILTDIDGRENLLPLSYTKHCAFLRIGLNTIQEKWQRALGKQPQLHTIQYLQVYYQLQIQETNLLVNALALPNDDLIKAINYLDQGSVLSAGDVFIAAKISSQEMDNFMQYGTLPNDKVDYRGHVSVIKYPWHLFEFNDEQIRLDFELVTKGRVSAKPHESATIIGDNVFIEPGAEVINCSLNALDGPIYIGKNANVLDGAFIRGPFALCESATVNMGAKIRSATTIGPHCKVGGEINNSILTGYSNKAHDGFLGNSVIGEWCNLGADTNNSNLKNNYGLVKVWNYKLNDFINTEKQFCGLIMGDHSKCGINTMFNTGTVVGVSANIFGAGFPPKNIPSFSWGGAGGFEPYDFYKAINTARAVMERRNITLDQKGIDVLKCVFELTKETR